MDATNAMEKQVVLRCFLPDINVLKATAKRMANVPGLKLNLYAKAGEVLIVITGAAASSEAANELCEGTATRFENDLGDSVYARGKVTLAQTVTVELTRKNRLFAAADAATGALLAEQMLTARNSDGVYDFGADSYEGTTIGPKLAQKVQEAQDGTNLADAASAMAVAAQKCSKSNYGVAFTGIGGEKGIVVAVASKYCVYIARVAPGADAQKQAALQALDIMRRDVLRMKQNTARMFKRGKPVVWSKPLKSDGSRRPILIGIIVLLVVVALLWFVSYKLTWFRPATSSSTAVDSTSTVVSTVTEDTDVSSVTVDVTPDSVVQASESYVAAEDGTVHPFG